MANSSSKNRRSQKPTTTPEQALIEGMFKGLWELVKIIFRLFRPASRGPKTNKAAERAALAEHWEQVELYALQETTWALAISEADKIVDAALKLNGARGATMGDRLRASEKQFPASLYQGMWRAHKLRNSVAHDVGVKIGDAQAREAITTMRQALYQLQVLT